MKGCRWVWTSLLMTVLGAGSAAAKEKSPLLGLEIGMTRHAALERLEKIRHEGDEHGTERRERDSDRGGESEAEAGQEIWTLTDPRYASVVLHFGHDEKLEWATAFSRPGGRPVLFRELGDLRRARRAGNTIYVWSVPARGRWPGYQLVARSQDPDTVRSVSLTVRVGTGAPDPSAPREEGR